MEDETENTSSNVIEFKRLESQPDAQFVVVVAEDGKPVKYYKYICSFEFNESTFGFHVWARDNEDAERRLAALKITGKVDGKLFSEVPA